MATSNGTDFFKYTFHYNPSVLPAILVIAGFSFVTIISFFLTLRFGGRFMYIIPSMGVVEIFGYALRIVTIEQKTLMPFIISSLFILVAPIALALVNYIVVGKLLIVSGKPIKIFGRELQPTRVAKIFF